MYVSFWLLPYFMIKKMIKRLGQQESIGLVNILYTIIVDIPSAVQFHTSEVRDLSHNFITFTWFESDLSDLIYNAKFNTL